jgi:allantoinase
VEELDLVLRAPRVVTAAGEVARRVGVADGRIVAIEPLDSDLTAPDMVDLGSEEVLLPGLVDTHVHVNEPGRTEWEGFATATRAAAAGGVTTILDMPLNSIPPTVDVAALGVKRKAAERQAWVDVGFWGGAVPGNLPELRGLHDAGVFGFKCFLLHSGVDEFPHLATEDLPAVLSEIRDFGSLLIVHAEDSDAIDRAPTAHGERYRDYLASRPRGAENIAIAQVIEAARWTRARAHILHLSSSDALPMIRTARRDGVRITVETCPHYLLFTAEEVQDGQTQFKCCPPIREADNRELLWHGLHAGDVDSIVSDHSPCTPELKRFELGDFGGGLGRNSLAAGRPTGSVDGGPPARVHPVRRGALDGRASGGDRRPAPQGPHRPGLPRGPLHLRPGRRVPPRPGPAAPPPSGHALRRAPAGRPGARYLAARPAHRRRRRPARTAAAPR